MFSVRVSSETATFSHHSSPGIGPLASSQYGVLAGRSRYKKAWHTYWQPLVNHDKHYGVLRSSIEQIAMA
jgi:hypothetical protein